MKVLVAPDKFKGSISALRAAEAIARGLGTVGAGVDIAPVADGGEGTMETLLSALGGSSVSAVVAGPFGAPVDAQFALLGDGSAIVELAQASGLQIVAASERDPVRASTYGTGELLRRVLSFSPDRVIVALGGSATVDGGTGLARALGVRFFDSLGRAIQDDDFDLRRIASINGEGLDQRVSSSNLVAAADVSTLLGDAARVFGPQKGASPGDIEILELGLINLGRRIEADLGVAVLDVPGGGAAGGSGAMLLGIGADLHSGAEIILDAINFDERLQAVDLVITGEGRLDEGTSAGKGPLIVARRASAYGIPCVALVGRATAAPGEFSQVFSLTDHFGDEQVAQDRCEEGLEALALKAIAEFL